MSVSHTRAVRPTVETPLFLKHTGIHSYIDEGPSATAPPIVMLHGMVGRIDNWAATVRAVVDRGYRALVPSLPIYSMPLGSTSIGALTDYVSSFLQAMRVSSAVVCGNSMGGHVATELAVRYGDLVEALVLTGASGVNGISFANGTIRRRDRDFIRERAALTFYDPVHVTEDSVEEAYFNINDRARAARLLGFARSAQRATLADRLHLVTCPTAIIWGRDDRITPPSVAKTLDRQVPDSELFWIEECGHAPMIEQPARFNASLLEFLDLRLGRRETRDNSSRGGQVLPRSNPIPGPGHRRNRLSDVESRS